MIKCLILILVLLLGILIYTLYHQDNRGNVNLIKTVIINTNSAYPLPSSIRQLSLEEVFSESEDGLVRSLPKEKIRVLIATGDVIPARSVNYQTTLRNNFIWPFEKTAEFLKSGDITFINLETPLLKDCTITQEGMSFCGSTKHVEGLIFAGVDIASLANNHAGNYGSLGVDETVKLLNESGILTTGTSDNNLVIKNIRGINFAFLGFNDIEKNPTVSNAEDEKIRTDIDRVKKMVDVVVVTFHWGAEYRNQPDERQVYLGHLAIDAGADLVIGNHPHWIQPIEFYKDKLITYAHGNFVFDQEWSQKTKEGVVGKYTFYNKSLIDVKFFPVQIDFYGQPHFTDEPQASKILNELKDESLKLNSSSNTQTVY